MSVGTFIGTDIILFINFKDDKTTNEFVKLQNKYYNLISMKLTTSSHFKCAKNKKFIG